MKTPIVGRGLLAVAFLAVWGVATGANAGVFRAFLSSTGNDLNTCALTAPCRLLPAALTAVVNGGRITMLDSANYNAGTVTITKSVTIDANPGVSASVAAINGDAIFINAAGVNVTLRNLLILNYSSGTNGIEFVQGSVLNVENCEISNMLFNGIIVVGTGNATIVHSIMTNNGIGAAAQDGAQVVVSASHVLGNQTGVSAFNGGSNTTKVTVSDTTLSGNAIALDAEGNVAGSDAQIFATRCTIAYNSDGIRSLTSNANASTLVTISANMITNNSVGIDTGGTSGKVKSLGNNHIADNGTNGAPTSTIALK